MRILIAAIFLLSARNATAAAELPIFDAHIHYSHDAVAVLPPKEAVAILRRAGVTRALVSSSDDDGTQKLLAEAPDLVIPELRPYRRRGDVATWARDASVLESVEQRLKTYKYVGIGEFHAYGAEIDTPVGTRVVGLAKEHGLFLHAHSDADAIERIFKQDPQARVLWAHAGFAPRGTVRAMLTRYKTLWCDLAFRSDHARGGKVAPEWRVLFEQFPDRFMLGTDTYTPERWRQVEEHARWSREWLKDLPRELAERIAHKNGEALFGSAQTTPAR
jgi:Amidohydrolase